ncbi:MAG: hypothetical protein IPJ65_12345 [Archangiaceae bacterium]|nr:hypothetical protein [Archangiaceae bacterium]
MRIHSLFSAAAVLFALSSCGDADSTADIGANGAFASEEEVATTGDALLSNSAAVWLPMQEGNTWTLVSETTGATKTIAFSDVGGGIGWLDGLSRSEGFWAGVSPSSPNTLYSWNYDLRQWEPLYRFGYAVTRWTIGAGCDKFTLQRTESDANVVTPAGGFTGVRTISYTLNPPITARCIVPALAEVSFAPGVGPVKLVTGAGEKFVLQSAKVNGKKYPLAGGQVTSKLTFDALTYVNKSNTIFCITTPCPGNAVNAVAKYSYTVTNGTATSQTWQFNSGCQHDLQLVSSSGKVVADVANGRFCTQSLTSVTLSPGQSKTFSGELELIDTEGLQLNGTYSAKAFMTPRSGIVSSPVVPASASLKVSVVPAIQ